MCDFKTFGVLFMDQNSILRRDAQAIITGAIAAVRPDAAVRRALHGHSFSGKVILVAVGKAAWSMARAAHDVLGELIDAGIVITKYGHVMGPIGDLELVEAGHPVPDDNSFSGTTRALELVRGLTSEDTVIFLLSGGGSALFELPLLPAEELQDITNMLLSCGAGITEINTVRKRLSAVKGGRFALSCAPARVYSQGAMELLNRETPKELCDVENVVTGSVSELCEAASRECSSLGYEPTVLTDRLCCQAREAGSFLGSVARTHAGMGRKLAFIAGGETVVKLTGSGLGGRNQELALAAAEEIDGFNCAVFSVGSDGTDGPTDAAGGYVDGATLSALKAAALDVHTVLADNDAYHALKAVNGLIITGPTGTNVNDVAVVLVSG